MPPSSRTATLGLWAGLVATDTAAQFLFKAAAARLDEPRIDPAWVAMVAQSPGVWAAVACLMATFGFWMLILRRSPLSSAFPGTALTLVGVALGAHFAFGESIDPIRGSGIALIVAGVAMLRPDRPDAAEAAPSRSS